jgi:hypothetical protein
MNGDLFIVVASYAIQHGCSETEKERAGIVERKWT